MTTLMKALLPMAVFAITAPGLVLADAEQDYMSKCAVCHGTGGQGDGPFAEFLKQGAPDLAVMAKNNGGAFPVAKATDTITGDVKGHGTREMPLWGTSMSKDDVAGMIGYLESIQAK